MWTNVAEVAAAGWTTWDVLGPLVGVIAGGVLGGVFQIIVAGRRDAFERRQDLIKTRREIYFQALEIVDRMRITIEIFARSNYGRKSVDECESDEEREEMRQRDEMSADALTGIFELRNGVRRVTITVSAVGSIRVREAINALDDELESYLDELGLQIEGDGIFRAGAAVAFQERYGERHDALSRAIRDDLNVDRLINERV